MDEIEKNKKCDQAKKGLVPFAGTVRDLVMVDTIQAQMMNALGRTRSPFHGVANWPYLDDELARYSRRFLKNRGEQKWQSAGGIWDGNGKPTCRLMSTLAAQVIRKLAANPGGLLWTDPADIIWAVRLVPRIGRDHDSLLGFAVSWPGNGIHLFDNQAREKLHAQMDKKAASANSLREEARQRFGQIAQRLWLAHRAEQLLWTIHLQVVAQRSSVVLLTDEQLGQIVWGGNRDTWPQDWRGDLMTTLRSLTTIHSEIWRLSSSGWRPQLGAHSVAVASVELPALTRPEENYCRPCCPLWNTGVRHNHVFVQVGLGFLGVLEKFRKEEDENGCREYDFKTQTDKEQRKELTEAKKSGELVSVSALTAIFGQSKWSGLTEANCRIIQAMIREITRGRGKNAASRPDKAEVLIGNNVPGPTAKIKVVCRFLKARGRYITFGGNGKRHGMGYLLIGCGWLAKCGYQVSEDNEETRKIIREFLKELGGLRDILGLTIVGFEPKSGEWFDYADLRALAVCRMGMEKLALIHLRIYAPENYQERLRRFYERQGAFSVIAGGVEEESDDQETDEEDIEAGAAGSRLELSVRIRQANIKQDELASHLGVSQQYVSQLMTGKRCWPEMHRAKAEALVEQRIGREDENAG